MREPDLQEHMAGTYFSLRWGMAVIAFILPLMLSLGGLALDGGPLRGSMSAYYHSPSMRDLFVGALVAIGACLYLYKGFSSAENIALNFAGLFVVGVALIPTEASCTAKCETFTAHRILAILFFLCIAYVSLFRASDTLSLMQDPSGAKRFRLQYRGLGIGMILSPIAALVLSIVVQAETKLWVLFAEVLAVWMFAAYWLVKSREMAFTHAERLALDMKLATSEPAPAEDPARIGNIVQTEP